MRKASLIFITLLSLPAFAQEAASNASYYAMSAAFVLGIAALGGALGQAKVGGAAMEGLARNPKASKEMFVPMIIGLALIESLVIYALVIAFQLVAKI